MIGIEGGFSRDHLVNTESGTRFNVPGGPGLYAALASALTTRWMEADPVPSAQPVKSARVFGSGADSGLEALLTSGGVDTRWLPIGRAPRLWILTSDSGRRIVSAEKHTNHELDERAIERDDQPQPPSGFLAGLDALLRCAPRTPHIDTSQSTLVAVDPDQRELAAHGWEYLAALARTTTVFLPSRVQLTQFDKNPIRAAEQIRNRTGRAVVGRVDIDGSYVLPVTGEIWHVPAVPATVIDTTGAGDSHAAALITALASPRFKHDLLRAATIASVIAARTVSGWGPEPLQHTSAADLGDINAVASTPPTITSL